MSDKSPNLIISGPERTAPDQTPIPCQKCTITVYLSPTSLGLHLSDGVPVVCMLCGWRIAQSSDQGAEPAQLMPGQREELRAAGMTDDEIDSACEQMNQWLNGGG